MKTTKLMYSSLMIMALLFTSCGLEDLQGLFKKKYSISQVCDVFRSPTYAQSGEEFRIHNASSSYYNNNGEGAKLDAADYPAGSYIMLEENGTVSGIADEDVRKRIEFSFPDDSPANLIVVKSVLYSAEGAQVMELWNYGIVTGLGDKGFLFLGFDLSSVPEGYGSFFYSNLDEEGTELTYIPDYTIVNDLSVLEEYKY